MRGSKINDLRQFSSLTPTLSLREREFFSSLLYDAVADILPAPKAFISSVTTDGAMT